MHRRYGRQQQRTTINCFHLAEQGLQVIQQLYNVVTASTGSTNLVDYRLL